MAAGDQVSEVWKVEVLGKHNELRARHHAPPLKWSDDCFQLAAKQSKACAKARDCVQGNRRGPNGPQGQNVGYPFDSAAKAVQHWYNELIKWVYDFEDHGSEASHMCSNFTQVIWADTEYVGMAVTNGYMVANYFPSGNREGRFKENVFPAPREALMAAYPCRTIWFDSLTPALNDFLNVCAEYISPSMGRGAHEIFVKDVKTGLSEGAKVRIVRESGLWQLSAAVRKGTSYCKYDQELVKKSWQEEHESNWRNLPKAYLQFKELGFRVPDRIQARWLEVAPITGLGVEEAVKNTFREADLNGDGYLSGDELGTVLVALGMSRKDTAKLIKAADRNGDGRLELDEFLSWIFGGTKKAQEALTSAEARVQAERERVEREKSEASPRPGMAKAGSGPEGGRRGSSQARASTLAGDSMAHKSSEAGRRGSSQARASMLAGDSMAHTRSEAGRRGSSQPSTNVPPRRASQR